MVIAMHITDTQKVVTVGGSKSMIWLLGGGSITTSCWMGTIAHACSLPDGVGVANCEL